MQIKSFQLPPFLVDEITPVVMETHDVEYRHDSKLFTIFGKLENDFSIELPSESVRHSIESLMAEIKWVVSEPKDFEQSDKSIFIAHFVEIFAPSGF